MTAAGLSGTVASAGALVAIWFMLSATVCHSTRMMDCARGEMRGLDTVRLDQAGSGMKWPVGFEVGDCLDQLFELGVGQDLGRGTGMRSGLAVNPVEQPQHGLALLNQRLR